MKKTLGGSGGKQLLQYRAKIIVSEKVKEGIGEGMAVTTWTYKGIKTNEILYVWCSLI